MVYFHQNEPLRLAISNCRTILWESTSRPTRCRELVAGWPDFIVVVDASSHGMGGIIIGKLFECPPTMLRLQWPPDITANFITKSNPIGTLTNSYLELAGLVILWIMMEHICTDLAEKQVALFSNNSPSVGWVQYMAMRSSLVAEQLIRVLALRFNIQRVCPITTLHICGDQNSMTNVPSRLFGSKPKWHFQSEEKLLTFFNINFPLPNQNLWTVCHPTSGIATHVISVLWMMPFTLEDWRQLPLASRNIGAIGNGMQCLWEWTLTYTIPTSPNASDSSLGLLHELAQASMVRACQVKNCTVSSALTAIGQTISNPTKIVGSERLLPCLQIMLDGYRKVDPPTQKNLPVQLEVPKLLVTTAYQLGTAEVQRAMVDFTMIAFYYLLWVGEYTVKGSRNKTKQTVQFKYEDVPIFKKNTRGQLCCLPCNATVDLILTADGATLKLDYQKNKWKGVCVYHESNGKRWHCPVCALPWHYLHLCNMGANSKTLLLVYYDDKGQHRDITNKDVIEA